MGSSADASGASESERAESLALSPSSRAALQPSQGHPGAASVTAVRLTAVERHPPTGAAAARHSLGQSRGLAGVLYRGHAQHAAIIQAQPSADRPEITIA